MIIDCDGCRARGPACHDCVVTVLLGPADGEATGPWTSGCGSAGRRPAPVLVHAPRPWVPSMPTVDLDAAERAAIAVLAGSGLVPPLRMVPAVPADGDLHPGDPADVDAGSAVDVDARGVSETYDGRRGQGTARAG